MLSEQMWLRALSIFRLIVRFRFNLWGLIFKITYRVVIVRFLCKNINFDPKQTTLRAGRT